MLLSKHECQRPYDSTSTAAGGIATLAIEQSSVEERQGQHRHRHSQEQGQVHQQQQQQRGAQRSPLPSSSTTLTSGEALTLRVVNPLDNLTTHQPRGIREGNVSERNQFGNRVLCRTPPPVYDSLPATPPPSYTPHSGVDVGVAGGATADGGVIVNAVARSPEIWQQCQPFSAQLGHNAADYREVVLPANSIVYHQQQQRQQLVQHSENVAATVEQQEQEQQQERLLEAHLQLGEQQQQQQQQQLRRRRRLHLLQQQRLSNINAASTDSTSSSNCSFDYRHNNNYHFNSSNQLGGSSSDSEAYARLPVGSERRQQCRQQRIGRGLRDAYCPDLLHACSLILHQHLEQPIEANDTSDSSVSNFTPTPPARTQSRCSTDYVEIEEIRPVTRDREAELFRELQPGSWQIQAARAISTPELVCRNDVGAPLNVACVKSPDVEYQRLIKNSTQRDMGQNLSLRRPRISLTWVLREQQQQSQQQQPNEVQTPTNDGDDEPGTTKKLGNGTAETPNNNNGCVIGTAEPKQRTEVVPTQLTTTSTTNTATTTTTTTTTKRYRLKQLPGSNDPLNGYATTPTAYMPANALAPQKFFSNQNLLEYRDKSRAPSRELLFVCTPQRLPKSYDTSDALSLAKKRNEIRKRLASKMATLQANGRAKADGAEANQLAKNGCASVAASGAANTNCVVLEKDELKSLKGTYSEPSLIAASDGHQRRHRHRKRRERNRGPKFGYEISNVDEFLSKCSLASPGNIPVVLSTPSTLYQTRPGQHQIEIPLPLGMVVNAVFKNQNWLYVQTPHAEEGYVGYSCCLPLGILPPSARSGSTSNNKPAPCWESNGDIFPRPGGNMTDSEKEIRLRGGTRSDGARTPRGKRGDAVGTDDDAKNGNTSVISAAASTCGEHQVDSLYLRAASQPRLVEKAYAQLKSTKQALALRNSGNDEYVTLQQQQHKSKLHVQKHMQQQQQQLQQLHQKHLITGPYITNGHNGQHLHPKNANISTMGSVSQAASVASVSHSASFAAKTPINGSVHDTNQQQNAGVLHMASRKQHGLRQTLVAINTDYSTDSIVLHKGEIVTLCECRESKDHQQWFYVRTRDGREGYIPAEVAGHGYL
ncbi:uncharacterized protein LOC129240564 [Anastrepha obliqua]|uniref:uncharacterized protein LOC129240564 n=1 Tax=Anastrepha obliqua TaxID=95512 RepID=UPI002409FD1C|nr:uncharacterized protein LOC129240564 [Anastrepha obliqua]